MIDELVRRFQERIKREPTVDYIMQVPPIRPRPPVSAEELATAETRLGFQLPPLLRGLYTQVGDGGYGPGRGLQVLLAGGEWSLVGQVESARKAGIEWPGKFVPLISWGCLYVSWVECSVPPYRVWLYDTDECAADEDFYPQADSLEAWLSAWLDGVDLWKAGKRRAG